MSTNQDWFVRPPNSEGSHAQKALLFKPNEHCFSLMNSVKRQCFFFCLHKSGGVCCKQPKVTFIRLKSEQKSSEEPLTSCLCLRYFRTLDEMVGLTRWDVSLHLSAGFSYRIVVIQHCQLDHPSRVCMLDCTRHSGAMIKKENTLTAL